MANFSRVKKSTNIEDRTALEVAGNKESPDMYFARKEISDSFHKAVTGQPVSNTSAKTDKQVYKSSIPDIVTRIKKKYDKR